MTPAKSPGYGPGKTYRTNTHPRSDYVIRGRVWIEKDGELYIGWGRAILLENIDRLGSIAAAARVMKLGYRNAWLWVDAMNRLAPEPLVEKTAGGPGGGQAKLTEAGRRAVEEYKDLRARFQSFLSEQE